MKCLRRAYHAALAWLGHGYQIRLLVVGVCFTQLVWAEESRMAPREADLQFERGKAALQLGHWPEACELFRRSMELDPSASTLVKLARCHEHDGRLKLASDDYARALNLLRERARDDEHARALRRLVLSSKEMTDSRLGRLLVRLNFRPRRFTLLVDGEAVAQEPEAPALFVDPGTHLVGVTAPGFVAEPLTVSMGEGETREIVLQLKAISMTTTAAALPQRAAVPTATAMPLARAASKPLALTAATNPVRPAVAALRGPTGTVTSSHQAYRNGHGQRFVAAATGGTGLILFGAAAYFGVKTHSLVDDATAYGHCDSNYGCDAHGSELMREAERKQTYALLLAGGGTLLLGTGLILWFTAPSSNHRAGATRPQLSLCLRLSGATLGGRW